MSRTVRLVFSEELDPERFLDVVVSLGGVRHPDVGTDGRLSRGTRHVWVFINPGESMELPEIEMLEDKLGAPVGSQVMLELSDEDGTDQLALELINAVAKHWHLVVDDLEETVFTVEELRVRAASRPQNLFWNFDL